MEPMNDLPNAADRKSIRKQEKAARLAERQRHEVITQIMSTTFGRAWFWDYLSSAHCFATTHVPGDALGSAFQEGRRSLGLELLSDILSACPDAYIQAMRESNERHHSNNRSPDPDDSAALAERRSGPLLDGGDSGALADQDAADDPTDYTSPGRDIYVEAPGS